MGEDEGEALLMGFAMGGDDGLAIAMIGEDEYQGSGKHRQSISGNESGSRPAGIIRFIAILVLLGIITWLSLLIILQPRHAS
ncbi:hypothetical protein AUG19_02630 [archaeon 13_1_20CM_2_54_9]|nr:MAG: hypothetical protein AUG19_02630 [archaeon 13_1_20CM_2_54_9]